MYHYEKNKCLFEKYFLSTVSIVTIRLPTPLFLYPMDTEKSLLAIRNTALEALSSLSLTEENMSELEKRPLLSELLKQTMVNAQKNLIAAFCLERYVEEEQKHATYVAELEKLFNDNDTDASATGLLCKYERKRKMYNDVRDVVTRLSDIVDETNRYSDAATIEFKPIFDGIAEMRRKYVRSFEEDAILCAAQHNETADVMEKFNSIEAQHRLWLQEYTDFMTTLMDWDDVAKLEFKVLQMHAKRNDINVAFEELLAEQSRGENLLV